VIYDQNNNPVPDGTPFRFHFNVISQDSSTQQQVDTETIDGVARAVYRIERSGVLEIHVSSEQGARSNLIRLDTLSGGVTVVPPTPLPTETPTPTPTFTPTTTPTATVVVFPRRLWRFRLVLCTAFDHDQRGQHLLVWYSTGDCPLGSSLGACAA
jgi:hypothetical protein